MSTAARAVVIAAFLLGPLCETILADDTMEQDVRKRFERAAADLPFFVTEEFAYNRAPHLSQADDLVARYAAVLRPCLSAGYDVAVRDEPNWDVGAHRRAAREVVRAMLDDPNARIRTLAAAALFATEDPNVLPDIGRLLGDKAETFPYPEPRSVAMFPARDPNGTMRDRYAPAGPPPMKPQTVGEVARGMLYFAHWSPGQPLPAPIDWLNVRMLRALEGKSEVWAGLGWPMRGVVDLAESLGPVDREVALLHLFTNPDLMRGLGNERLLIFAARRLGPERVLKLLAHESVTPALRGEFAGGGFLLEHATEILRPTDAPALLALARKYRQPAAFAAAARLAPEDAVVILHEAIDHPAKWVSLGPAVTALWDLVGPAQSTYLVNWLYASQTVQDGGVWGRTEFVQHLTERFRPADRQLLAALVNDARLDELDWQTLRAIAQGLNANLLEPVVPPRSLRDTSHPMGQLRTRDELATAREKYPKETEALLRTIAEWRQQIRDSVPRWATP